MAYANLHYDYTAIYVITPFSALKRLGSFGTAQRHHCMPQEATHWTAGKPVLWTVWAVLIALKATEYAIDPIGLRIGTEDSSSPCDEPSRLNKTARYPVRVPVKIVLALE